MSPRHLHEVLAHLSAFFSEFSESRANSLARIRRVTRRVLAFREGIQKRVERQLAGGQGSAEGTAEG